MFKYATVDDTENILKWFLRLTFLNCFKKNVCINFNEKRDEKRVEWGGEV